MHAAPLFLLVSRMFDCKTYTNLHASLFASLFEPGPFCSEQRLKEERSAQGRASGGAFQPLSVAHLGRLTQIKHLIKLLHSTLQCRFFRVGFKLRPVKGSVRDNDFLCGLFNEVMVLANIRRLNVVAVFS
jgi:hypothetical protein